MQLTRIASVPHIELDYVGISGPSAVHQIALGDPDSDGEVGSIVVDRTEDGVIVGRKETM